MKSSQTIIIICFFAFNLGFSQSKNFIEHTVIVGDNVTQIAKKYSINPEDIYKLNPKAQDGISIGQVLLIPAVILRTNVELSIDKKQKTHIVQAKETKFGISNQYNVEIEDLENANPSLKNEELKIGQKLIIPIEDNVVVNESNVSKNQKLKTIYHTVQPKETKFGIAEKYNISIEELEKQNPEIIANLESGAKLKIIKLASKDSSIQSSTKNEKPNTANVEELSFVEYKIKPDETIFSLTNLFNLSEQQLYNLNPELKGLVKAGMIIKIPSNFIKPKQREKKTVLKLENSIYSAQKELVLFLPFNVNNVKKDTTQSIQQRLAKDKFLNMTLDFYAGAKMAIDSAKVMGYNLKVKIFDSQENKNGTSALNIIANNDFSKTDAVIGPFYQSNIEKVAAGLEDKKIAIISPLSRDAGRPFSNLYQSMPSNESVKNAMFDYMNSKNGNIIAVIDPKKNAVKQYILEFQKGCKFTNFDAKGNFVADSLKKHFIKDKVNYVILASEKTGTILSLTNTMIASLKNFEIQLVILEPNETLDFEEIQLNRLTKLKLTYPSIKNESETLISKKFALDFKKKNKVFPSDNAVRGFDITFDTMMRILQNKTFEETITDGPTEQVENKFEYVKKSSGGYSNFGIYILNYENDLTIKQAQ